MWPIEPIEWFIRKVATGTGRMRGFQKTFGDVTTIRNGNRRLRRRSVAPSTDVLHVKRASDDRYSSTVESLDNGLGAESLGDSLVRHDAGGFHPHGPSVGGATDLRRSVVPRRMSSLSKGHRIIGDPQPSNRLTMVWEPNRLAIVWEDTIQEGFIYTDRQSAERLTYVNQPKVAACIIFS